MPVEFLFHFGLSKLTEELNALIASQRFQARQEPCPRFVAGGQRVAPHCVPHRDSHNRRARTRARAWTVRLLMTHASPKQHHAHGSEQITRTVKTGKVAWLRKSFGRPTQPAPLPPSRPLCPSARNDVGATSLPKGTVH